MDGRAAPAGALPGSGTEALCSLLGACPSVCKVDTMPARLLATLVVDIEFRPLFLTRASPQSQGDAPGTSWGPHAALHSPVEEQAAPNPRGQVHPRKVMNRSKQGPVAAARRGHGQPPCGAASEPGPAVLPGMQSSPAPPSCPPLSASTVTLGDTSRAGRWQTDVRILPARLRFLGERGGVIRSIYLFSGGGPGG